MPNATHFCYYNTSYHVVLYGMGRVWGHLRRKMFIKNNIA
jgi:hypothetical protein